jgi:hypothetical protein
MNPGLLCLLIAKNSLLIIGGKQAPGQEDEKPLLLTFRRLLACPMQMSSIDGID